MRSAWRQIMQPEFELVLLCATPAKEERHNSRIRALVDQDLDWARVEEFADWHRLVPLLYWELKATRPDRIPPSIADSFERNMRNNLLLTGELFRVLSLFDRAGIPAIPFKGPALAAGVYGNLALRTFGDLDVLVPPADAWRARDLLLGEGYRSNLQLHPARRQDYLRSYDEFTLYGDNALLEIHWGFIPPHFSISLDTAAFLERREQLLLGNRSIPSLRPEDLLLVLCVHGAKHCWTHFGLVADIAWLMTKHSLPSQALLARAKEAGCHRIVLVAAKLACEVLEAPLAEPVARAIDADPAVSVLAGEVLDAIFGKRHDETDILSSARLHMRMRERLRDRLRYAFRLLTRPGVEDWQMIDLPAALSFLYPVLRYPRLALKYRSKTP
jgi:hypothetical protein